MPIVVSRATGEIISRPELTQADRDRAWEAVVIAFARRHPELLVQVPPEYHEQVARDLEHTVNIILRTINMVKQAG